MSDTEKRELELEIAELEEEAQDMDPSTGEWSWTVGYLCSLRELLDEEDNDNY